MARKKKKKSPKVTVDPERILADAEAMVAQNRYIRAREGFKRLFKIDPSQYYRQRLIEVTSLAVDEAIEQGKTKLPGQWFEHMRDSLNMTPAELQGIELKICSQQNNGELNVSLAQQLLVSAELEGDRRFAADTLVLAKAPEASAVTQSISHLCRREWKEASQELEVIGRKSPFSHWRLFVKGCLFYYQGKKEDADKCFSRLPAGTVPAKKAQAFGKWRWDQKIAPSDDELIEASELDGEAVLASSLKKAQFFWKQGQPFKSYETLHSSKSGFPSYEASLSGQLTHFFQTARFNLKDRLLDKWFRSVKHAAKAKRYQGPNDQLALLNILLLEFNSPESDLWEDYLAARESVCGIDKRFRATVYYHEAMAEYQIDCPCETCLQGVYPIAKIALSKAIKADETFLPPYEELLKVHKKLNESSERNRLLDRMAVLFPESETALVEGGIECINRKSYAKAITFLRKAQKISPLSKKVGENLRLAFELKGLGHFKKGPKHWAKGRDCFESLIRESKEVWQGGFRMDSINLIKWSVVEEFMTPGDSSGSEAILQRLPEMDSHLFEFISFIYYIHYGEDLKMRGGRKQINFSKMPEGHTPQKALEILKFFMEIYFPTLKEQVYQISAKAVTDYLTPSLGKLKISDRALAIDFFEYLSGDRTYFWKKNAHAVVKKWLKLDKNDPLFQLWHAKMAEKDLSVSRIKKIEQEARKRNDSKALQEVEKLKNAEVDPFGAHGDEEPFPPMPGPPIEEFQTIEGILDLLAGMTAKERISMLMQSGMSRSEAVEFTRGIDEMVNETEASGLNDPFPPAPKKQPKRPKPSKPNFDPFEGQQELPF